MGSVRKMDAAGNLEWTTYLNHGADWEEGSHAMQVGDYYYAWTQDAGDNSSHAWVLDAGGAEIDSVFITCHQLHLGLWRNWYGNLGYSTCCRWWLLYLRTSVCGRLRSAVHRHQI